MLGPGEQAEGETMRQVWSEAAGVAMAPWPPDDTEESVVGSEFHQHVIDAARDGLRMAGQAGGAEWAALSQVALAGFQRPDGSAYTMLPDVFVHPRPNPRPESGTPLTLAEVGVPLLTIEVLSETTYRQDLDLEGGKGWSYAAAGVGAYLLVDITGRYMEEHVRALRLVGGRWTRWAATPGGRWESAELGVAFSFDGLYLRVYDAAGRLTPLPQQAHALLLEQAATLRDQEATLRQREATLQRLRALAAAGDLAAMQALLGLPPDPLA